MTATQTAHTGRTPAEIYDQMELDLAEVESAAVLEVLMNQVFDGLSVVIEYAHPSGGLCRKYIRAVDARKLGLIT